MTLPEPLRGCSQRPGAPESEITGAESRLPHPLPDDYKELLRDSGGIEGFVAPGVYLSLWPVGEIAQLNEAYAVSEFLPGAVLIGTDGGDTGYGFMPTNAGAQWISVPLVGMAPEEVCRMGSSMVDFLEHLRSGRK